MYSQTKITRRIGALLLMPLVFFCSLGLQLDIHYCGNKVADLQFFGEAEACIKMQNLQPSNADGIHRKSCCEHLTVWEQGNLNTVISGENHPDYFRTIDGIYLPSFTIYWVNDKGQYIFDHPPSGPPLRITQGNFRV